MVIAGEQPAFFDAERRVKAAMFRDLDLAYSASGQRRRIHLAQFVELRTALPQSEAERRLLDLG